MMGRLTDGQGQLFYEHCLEKLVPPDHLARKLAAVLDLGWVSGELSPYYSHTGRPSVAPELMIRMLIVGYVFAIRSERQLCSEVQVNLAYRWFCGLGIEDPIPNHSVFSRARHERFREADVLRRVFECVVGTCIEKGLVDGVSFSLDASHIRADVNQVKRVPGDQADALPDRQRASRAVREYLDSLDREDADEGKRQPKPPKALSLTDPQAAWVAKRNTRAFFAYDANYLIDNKLGVIVDAEGTRANRIEENRAAIAMVERVAERFDLKPKRLAADTAYGSGKTLRSLTDRGIEPHIPVWDKSTRNDGTFSRSDLPTNDFGIIRVQWLRGAGARARGSPPVAKLQPLAFLPRVAKMTASERRPYSAPTVIAPMLVFVLLGCTPVGYIKSGATDEQVKQDLTDCTEIARHQAFRDRPSLEFQLGLGYGPVHRRDRSLFALHRPSYAEVQHRYRRVCMIARGYDLAPLEDQK